jgi:hypothetical protein
MPIYCADDRLCHRATDETDGRRNDRRTLSRYRIIAVGFNSDGRREALRTDIGASEAETP